jgi:molecular chaperone DnaK
MVHDAESHAEDDKKRKELVEARNHAEAMMHSVAKMLEEHGDKISAEEKAEIEAKIEDVKSVLASEDAAEIGAKMEQLGQASMKLGEAVYKNAEAPDGGMAEGMDGMDGMASGAPGEADSDDEPQPDNVVDADFEELDDEDKNQRSN